MARKNGMVGVGVVLTERDPDVRGELLTKKTTKKIVNNRRCFDKARSHGSIKLLK